MRCSHVHPQQRHTCIRHRCCLHTRCCLLFCFAVHIPCSSLVSPSHGRTVSRRCGTFFEAALLHGLSQLAFVRMRMIYALPPAPSWPNITLSVSWKLESNSNTCVARRPFDSSSAPSVPLDVCVCRMRRFSCISIRFQRQSRATSARTAGWCKREQRRGYLHSACISRARLDFCQTHPFLRGHLPGNP